MAINNNTHDKRCMYGCMEHAYQTLLLAGTDGLSVRGGGHEVLRCSPPHREHMWEYRHGVATQLFPSFHAQQGATLHL